MNCRMPALREAFAAAGFTNVTTVISSGNVVFDARTASEVSLARTCEKAMDTHMGRSFYTIVRPVSTLERLLAEDPFAGFTLRDDAKRIVTFLGDGVVVPAGLKLPMRKDGDQIMATNGREVFSAYVPSPRGPTFMTLIEKTFGKDVTTRTWDTVRKLAKA